VRSTPPAVVGFSSVLHPAPLPGAAALGNEARMRVAELERRVITEPWTCASTWGSRAVSFEQPLTPMSTGEVAWRGGLAT
jgi:hypothetical protein